MLTRQSHTNLTAAMLLLAVIALLVHQSYGYKPAPSGPTQPAIIATFDLEKTFNALFAKAAADSDLLKMANDMNTDGESRKKALDQMAADMEDHPKGSEKYKELLDKWTLTSQKYRAFVDFCKAKIDNEKARNLKRIYGEIRKAADKMAVENHYAVVFVDDSIAEIPAGTEEETNRQISARRMVYTSPEVDVTQELISRMNKAFIDAGGVVPPKPAPATQPNGAAKPAPADKPKADAKSP